jgi:hypothetical protein
MSLPELYGLAHAGDPAAAAAAQHSLGELATSMDQVAATLRAPLGTLGAGWQGRAADAAHAGITGHAEWAGQAARRASALADETGRYVASARTVITNIPDPATVAATAPGAGGGPAGLNAAAVEQAETEATQRARDLFARHAEVCGSLAPDPVLPATARPTPPEPPAADPPAVEPPAADPSAADPSAAPTTPAATDPAPPPDPPPTTPEPAVQLPAVPLPTATSTTPATGFPPSFGESGFFPGRVGDFSSWPGPRSRWPEGVAPVGGVIGAPPARTGSEVDRSTPDGSAAEGSAPDGSAPGGSTPDGSTPGAGSGRDGERRRTEDRVGHHRAATPQAGGSVTTGPARQAPGSADPPPRDRVRLPAADTGPADPGGIAPAPHAHQHDPAGLPAMLGAVPPPTPEQVERAERVLDEDDLFGGEWTVTPPVIGR